MTSIHFNWGDRAHSATAKVSSMSARPVQVPFEMLVEIFAFLSEKSILEVCTSKKLPGVFVSAAAYSLRRRVRKLVDEGKDIFKQFGQNEALIIRNTIKAGCLILLKRPIEKIAVHFTQNLFPNRFRSTDEQNEKHEMLCDCLYLIESSYLLNKARGSQGPLKQLREITKCSEKLYRDGFIDHSIRALTLLTPPRMCIGLIDVFFPYCIEGALFKRLPLNEEELAIIKKTVLDRCKLWPTEKADTDQCCLAWQVLADIAARTEWLERGQEAPLSIQRFSTKLFETNLSREGAITCAMEMTNNQLPVIIYLLYFENSVGTRWKELSAIAAKCPDSPDKEKCLRKIEEIKLKMRSSFVF